MSPPYRYSTIRPGDVWLVEFNPVREREQGKHRTALGQLVGELDMGARRRAWELDSLKH